MKSFWRMTTGAVALMAVFGAMGSTVSAETEAEATLLSFTISPPEGFEVSTDQNSPAGLHTVEEFVALTGQSGQFGSDPAMESALLYVQVWDAPDATRGISIVVATPSSSQGASFVAGVLAGAGSEQFDTGVKDQAGRILHLEGVTEHVAAWHQGRYGVLVLGASLDPARSEEVARNLALRQSVQLTSVLGLDAKVEGSSSSDTSLAYRAGQIAAIVAIVGAIVAAVLYFTTRSSRRKKQQQWTPYPSGFVPQLPPTPTFPSTPAFPPTAGEVPAPPTSPTPPPML